MFLGLSGCGAPDRWTFYLVLYINFLSGKTFLIYWAYLCILFLWKQEPFSSSEGAAGATSLYFKITVAFPCKMQAVHARLRSDTMILFMCSSETACFLATQKKAMLTFWVLLHWCRTTSEVSYIIILLSDRWSAFYKILFCWYKLLGWFFVLPTRQISFIPCEKTLHQEVYMKLYSRMEHLLDRESKNQCYYPKRSPHIYHHAGLELLTSLLQTGVLPPLYTKSLKHAEFNGSFLH